MEESDCVWSIDDIDIGNYSIDYCWVIVVNYCGDCIVTIDDWWWYDDDGDDVIVEYCVTLTDDEVMTIVLLMIIIVW